MIEKLNELQWKRSKRSMSKNKPIRQSLGLLRKWGLSNKLFITFELFHSQSQKIKTDSIIHYFWIISLSISKLYLFFAYCKWRFESKFSLLELNNDPSKPGNLVAKTRVKVSLGAQSGTQHKRKRITNGY